MMGVSPEPEVKCDRNYHEEGDVEIEDSGGTCGSVLAFPYFISFYVLCSFLVSSRYQQNYWDGPNYSLDLL